MKLLQQRGFFNGLLLGMTLSFMTGLVVLYLLTMLGIISVSILEVPQIQLLLEWLQYNLGLSIVPFGITLGLYVHSLRMMQQGLHDKRPPDEISQLEHLNDVWTSLFFGIGVIWTAIVTPDYENLWNECLDVLYYWIDCGINIFRVDNPHTKPFYFWNWIITEVKKKFPDVLFLAEAFTGPKIMQQLAKHGYTQSYTYFSWRDNKHELIEYMEELTKTEQREY